MLRKISMILLVMACLMCFGGSNYVYADEKCKLYIEDITKYLNSNNVVVNNVVPANNTPAPKNSTYVNTSNAVVEEDIPYTGVEDTIMYVIIVALAISLVFYIKFEKINKEM